MFASRLVNHNGSESYQLSEWQIMASGIVIHQQLHSSFACRFIRTHVLGLEPYLVGGRRWLVWNSAAGEVSAEFQPNFSRFDEFLVPADGRLRKISRKKCNRLGYLVGGVAVKYIWATVRRGGGLK